MNKQYEQVKKFHEACGIEMPDKPTLLDIGPMVTNSWLSEPIGELSEKVKNINRLAMNGQEIGGEVAKRVSYMLEEIAEFAASGTIEDQTDALTDLIYFALGTFTLMGVKPEKIFNEVQAANMRKVVNGKVLRNEQGKIVKPDGWYGPEAAIKAEIERQSKCAACEGKEVVPTGVSHMGIDEMVPCDVCCVED